MAFEWVHVDECSFEVLTFETTIEDLRMNTHQIQEVLLPKRVQQSKAILSR